MADVLYLLLLVAFFALAAGFVKACEVIIGPDEQALPIPRVDEREPEVRAA
ncbi:MAG TPA: hypothetical protein VGR20_14805 [Acidimicrobiia bacterium]|nr:hypothetical protein [Acidimicrobiia bacterium]